MFNSNALRYGLKLKKIYMLAIGTCLSSHISESYNKTIETLQTGIIKNNIN